MLINACTAILIIICKTLAFYDKEYTPNVGTVLFGTNDIKKKQWAKTDIGLLRARRYFQTLLPPPIFINTFNEDYVNILLGYFKDAYSAIKREAIDRETDTIMTTALSDAIGGYLKVWVLPVAKLDYYGGTVSQDNVVKLFQFYNEIKTYLTTDGGGWRQPDENVLNSITINVAPLKYVSNTRSMKDPCDYLAYFEKTPSGLTIPIPYVNWNEKASTMFIPLKNISLIPMNSPDSAHNLIKFYDAAKSCIQSSNPKDQDKFDERFQNWLTSDIVPHLKDEHLYLALGSVLTLVNRTRELCNTVIGLYSNNKLVEVPKPPHIPVDLTSKKMLIICVILLVEVAWCIPALIYILCSKKVHKKDCSSNVYLYIENKPDKKDKASYNKSKISHPKDGCSTILKDIPLSESQGCGPGFKGGIKLFRRSQLLSNLEFEGQYPSSLVANTFGAGTQSCISSKEQSANGVNDEYCIPVNIDCCAPKKGECCGPKISETSTTKKSECCTAKKTVCCTQKISQSSIPKKTETCPPKKSSLKKTSSHNLTSDHTNSTRVMTLSSQEAFNYTGAQNQNESYASIQDSSKTAVLPMDIDKCCQRSKRERTLKRDKNEERKKADDRKLLEECKKADDRKLLEECKKLDEINLLDEYKKLDERKKAEECRRHDERKKTEEFRRLEERKKADECKKLEERKKLEETKRNEDRKKAADECRKQERKRLEECKKTEERRKANECGKKVNESKLKEFKSRECKHKVIAVEKCEINDTDAREDESEDFGEDNEMDESQETGPPTPCKGPICPCTGCLQKTCREIKSVSSSPQITSESISESKIVLDKQVETKTTRFQVTKECKTTTRGKSFKLSPGQPYLEITIDRPTTEICVDVSRGQLKQHSAQSKPSKIPKLASNVIQPTTIDSARQSRSLSPSTKQKSLIPQPKRKTVDDIALAQCHCTRSEESRLNDTF